MANDHDGENLVVETSIQIDRWLSSCRQVALLSFLLSLPASFLTGCDSCEQRVEDSVDAVKTFFVYVFWIIVIGIVISILIAIIVAIVKWKREKSRKEAEADRERRKQAARDAEAAELAASNKEVVEAWKKETSDGSLKLEGAGTFKAGKQDNWMHLRIKGIQGNTDVLAEILASLGRPILEFLTGFGSYR